MALTVETPTVADLTQALDTLADWQQTDAPFQVHPGDIGWHWRLGAEATAAACRLWRRGTAIVAIGLLDGPDLLRLAIAPDLQQDQGLAEQLETDLADPDRGVLPAGQVYVESPVGALVHTALGQAGWPQDEPWSVLRRDLVEPVEDCGVAIESVGPEQAAEWSRVHHAAFGVTVGLERIIERWHATASGPAYQHARSLLARDEHGQPVASIIVWSAGPGRPGLIEPMGAHPAHRGHGYGRAITLAGAAALREMGCSTATVATPSSNIGAVATYRSAGLTEVTQRFDRRRD